MPYKNIDKARESGRKTAQRRRALDRAAEGDIAFKARRRAEQARFRAAHPDYYRSLYQKHKCSTKNLEQSLQRLYGLTLDQFAACEEAQDFQCPICGDVPRRGFCVDHDHATGAFRGLLCDRCNGGLGMFNDDSARLTAAAAYLELAS